MCVSGLFLSAVTVCVLDSCSECPAAIESLFVCVTVDSADLDRFLLRCLPTLPCLMRFRALASWQKGEVGLLLGLWNFESVLSMAQS